MSAPDLRRALDAHTEEEAAEAIAALCPRAAVLVVAQATGIRPSRCVPVGAHRGKRCAHDAERVRYCPARDRFCLDCCDFHACPEAL